MPQFFLNKRLIFLLVSLIIVVALIGFSLKDREATWPEQFVMDTSGFVQFIFHEPVRKISDYIETMNHVRHTYKENELLKARLDEFVRLESKARILEEENEKLRAMLEKTESLMDYTTIQATVVARNPDQWHELLIVNKGEVHGVKANMAVITANGLIGKVKVTSQFSSVIQLLSTLDKNNRISAVVQGNENIFGIIEGYDKEREQLLFKQIPSNKEVELNKQVVSSGWGGIFPAGLVIGEITEVVPDEYGLTQTAYVTPAADLYQIDHVMIVERQMPMPETAEFEEEAS
ncbi:rod shape-determining protein MreC [Bacillus sp. HMF5848]|uniref:rod shape-determining protein MreC n=1 Tax=Bacillus sp. HMF5848 TaxID=2495421 RepID=UPI000F7678C6|nr:rod shape-determining protein MreC [Bacillus sp. HMF5848]RSK28014.1 rod shape-determining protein MreC [Bacillus sp. HMF5848]